MTYERLSTAELDVGAPLGMMPPVDRNHDGSSTRRALENAVAEAVTAGPCYVLFSGGRDSSLILALAIRAARLLGAPDPVPVTAIYPGQDEADESHWQDLVLRHLAVHERVILRFTDERSTLGDIALRHLRRRGLVWPDATQTQPALYGHLEPGTVLTGEGGDAFLEARRITPLYLLRSQRRLPSRTLMEAAVRALAPAPVAARDLRRQCFDPEFLPWLQPTARAVLAEDALASREPLPWDAATWTGFDQRMNRLALDNPEIGAGEYGHMLRHPIAEPPVVAALAAEGGRWGFRGRTSLFRRLAADLLPDAVLARRSKASFNASRWGERERQFAEKFSGGVFSPSFIDEERLRQEWLSERPHPATFFLAHVAWLHQEGLPLIPATTQRGAERT